MPQRVVNAYTDPVECLRGPLCYVSRSTLARNRAELFLASAFFFIIVTLVEKEDCEARALNIDFLKSTLLRQGPLVVIPSVQEQNGTQGEELLSSWFMFQTALLISPTTVA